MIIRNLLQALAGDNWAEADVSLQAVESAGLWREALLAVRSMPMPSSAVSQGFQTLWTTRGHRIREQAADDIAMLDALRVLLPPYTGGIVTLYRGESLERWNAGRLGSAWTTRRDIAEMFAGGLNAIEPDGGVLLATDAIAGAVIAGPNHHSVWLDEHEYVVDRRQLRAVILVERFPPLAGNR